MGALIDTIIHNFYVPPLIFAVRKNKDNSRVIKYCIDGKQRISSIVGWVALDKWIEQCMYIDAWLLLDSWTMNFHTPTSKPMVRVPTTIMQNRWIGIENTSQVWIYDQGIQWMTINHVHQ